MRLDGSNFHCSITGTKIVNGNVTFKSTIMTKDKRVEMRGVFEHNTQEDNVISYTHTHSSV